MRNANRVGGVRAFSLQALQLIPARCIAVAVLAAQLAACTPQTALLAAAVPDGTTSMVLSHAQRVPDANRRRIAAYEQARDWTGLAQFAEENLKRDPQTPDWWMVAGYAYAQQGRHERAAERYSEAVRLEPDVALGWSLLAQSYRDAGKPQRALNALNNALLAKRDDPQLHWLLGETESDLRHWREAVNAYRAAIDADAQFLPAWQGLARAYEQSGRSGEARDARRTLERLKVEQDAKRRAPQTNTKKGSP